MLPKPSTGNSATNKTRNHKKDGYRQRNVRQFLHIFDRLRAIVRYWSEIATFSYPLAFYAPVGVFLLEFREKFGPQKTRTMGLSDSEDSLTIG